MTETELNKYSCYHPNIFKSEPPKNLQIIKKTFVGRDNLLKKLTAKLNMLLDVPENNTSDFNKQPMIIHGESRSGKSHLARRLLLELPNDDKHFQYIVHAREQLTAFTIMRSIFIEISKIYQESITTSKGDILDENNDIIRITTEIIAKVKAIFLDNDSVTTAEITIDSLSSDLSNFRAEVSPFKIFKLGIQNEVSCSDGKKLKITLTKPGPEEIAVHCGAIVDVMLRLNLLKHVIILADDVDLLETYQNKDLNGSKERSVLASALCKLSCFSGIDVLVTARSWYYNSKKEFNELVDLSFGYGLDPEDLVRIHDLRFDTYTSRDNLPKSFLTDDALQKLSEKVNGLPGIFLDYLNTLFDIYIDDDNFEKRNFDWVCNVLTKFWNTCKSLAPEAAKTLTDHIKNTDAGYSIDVTDINYFARTKLDNIIVYQRYDKETSFLIPEIMQYIIEKQIPVNP